MSTSRSSQRSSTSPFRSRKGPGPSSAPKQGSRPTTPVSSSRLTESSRLSPVYPVGYPGVEAEKPKESVTVTVRFRPLNAREINKGDEVAWYADGDYIVRNEYNLAIAYRYDKVFGPATTTHQIYDVAAQHVVSSAMEGINGTVFAYGVTSSGKTHTMHGDQKSPGIIPLAVKDVFSIIQETPGREFLLRVSYLEIYNEVINDLLDPAGQNLRIREDSQGIYVEGIKEEVVLSPAHALSLIASGEEHRHVGSNNFNLMSSRSHTIFTMTIESSPMESQGKEDVTLSQLNLIDLAGSESSKTETTGLRRKEGSYINKSLLTLGTVISKLTDSKATHVPYRDSKLTRLLQSSLSGYGRVSLICTVTPASSNSEETHNTLKFADRSKHVEIKAAQNKILDEKSLIKKYQKEISSLRRELQQLKERMMQNQYVVTPSQEDLVSLKLQFEAGQVKLQTRLEEEEQAKAALMGRIQRLTKLILVSTKNSLPSNIPEKADHRRRHSFREDELAYLPDRKREHLIDDDDVSFDSEFSTEGKCDSNDSDVFRRTGIKNRKRGMLEWFKLRKPEHSSGLSTGADSDSNVSGSTSCSQPLNEKIFGCDVKAGRRRSLSSFSDITQAGDLFSVATTGRHPQLTVSTVTDQMDLISEQMKVLAGEVALCTSSLKRVNEQASTNPQDLELQGQIRRLNDEISEKKFQMHVLEQRMIASFDAIPHASNNLVMSEALSKLAAQFNEKTFEHEIVMADNRILQDQLQQKISENAELQETIFMLRQQHDSLDTDPCNSKSPVEVEAFGVDVENQSTDSEAEAEACENIYNSTSFLSNALSNASSNDSVVSSLKSQVLMQAAEIETLRQELLKLSEEKNDFEIHSEKLSEEASYAKELASAAAVELKNLAEEVTKLSYQNSQLTADLAMSKKKGFPKHDQFNGRHGHYVSTQTDASVKGSQDATLIDDMEKELAVRCQIEASLMATISEKDRRESELQKLIEEAREREERLENELANMWIHISKGNKFEVSDEIVSNEDTTELHNGAENKPVPGNTLGGQYCEDRLSVTNNGNDKRAVKQSRTAYEDEKRRKEVK